MYSYTHVGYRRHGSKEEMMEKVTLDIGGMSCGHCVAAVRGALASLPGVQVEEVRIGSATVSYDPAATSVEKVADAIREEGYEPAPAR
jgi:copper chaperone CopZ